MRRMLNSIASEAFSFSYADFPFRPFSSLTLHDREPFNLTA
jgi:hypothetical protein